MNWQYCKIRLSEMDRETVFTHNKPIDLYKDAETGMKTITIYFSIEYIKEKGTNIIPGLNK